MERRFIATPAEVRASVGRSLVGYASVFDSPGNIGDFQETVARGAFTRTLADGHDVQALVSHDPSQLIGRTANGSLRLSEDSRGLAFEVRDVPPTQYGNDILTLVKAGLVSGASFAFTTKRDGSSDVWRGKSRTLVDIDLWEISIVANPAYTASSVAARHYSEARAAVAPGWAVGADRDLPIDDSVAWDGEAATERMLNAAGYGGNSPDPGKAKRGFLAWDSHNASLRGSFKLPFADIVDGDLRAIRGGIDAASRMLTKTDIPLAVRADAKLVIDHYEDRMNQERSAAWRRRIAIAGV